MSTSKQEIIWRAFAAAVVAGRCHVRFAFPRCSVRPKQPGGFWPSHSPWLAPIGHRQPARADVPPKRGSVCLGAPAAGFLTSNSIESSSSAAAAEASIPERNRV